MAHIVLVYGRMGKFPRSCGCADIVCNLRMCDCAGEAEPYTWRLC